MNITISGDAVYMIDESQLSVQFDAECFQCIGHCDTVSVYTRCSQEVHTEKFLLRPKECNLRLVWVKQ